MVQRWFGFVVVDSGEVEDGSAVVPVHHCLLAGGLDEFDLGFDWESVVVDR